MVLLSVLFLLVLLLLLDLDLPSSPAQEGIVEHTPQWEDTPTPCTPQYPEIVTQECMGAEQLELERLKVEEKRIAFDKSVEDYRNKKSR